MKPEVSTADGLWHRFSGADVILLSSAKYIIQYNLSNLNSFDLKSFIVTRISAVP